MESQIPDKVCSCRLEGRRTELVSTELVDLTCGIFVFADVYRTVGRSQLFTVVLFLMISCSVGHPRASLPMGPLVPRNGNVALPCELPRAHGASVGLVPGMSPLVLRNVALVGEARWAHGASVWLLPRVPSITTMYSDFDVILGPFPRAVSSATPTPTRAVCYAQHVALLGAHADRVLVGACNPML